MKTYIVTVSEKDNDFVSGLFKKLKLHSKVLTEEESVELGLSEAINKGMQSEDVPKEKLLTHFRKHGVDC